MADAAAPPRAALKIDGRRYEGWTSLRTVRSIESATGEFVLELATREFTDAPRWPLRTGDACSIELDGETVISGYIDGVDPQFDADGYSITVSGRDRAADLVDCSAVHKPGSWSNQRIEAIAAELAKPFGITVTAKADTGEKVKRFALQQGETVYAAIDRLARYRALLAVSNSSGDIELIRPGGDAIVARLVEGQNILGGRASHDSKDRFSQYIVKGQASGDDRVNGKAAAAVKGEASDPGVARYRPLILIGEDQSTTAGVRNRAAFEATSRAAKAQRATVPVAGWRREDGQLWTPNVRVSLTSPFLLIDGTMLVSEVAFVKDDRGTVTELTVTLPDAYNLLAVPESADAAAVGAL
jgi:prophage tail gpP-like protein